MIFKILVDFEIQGDDIGLVVTSLVNHLSSSIGEFLNSPESDHMKIKGAVIRSVESEEK